MTLPSLANIHLPRCRLNSRPRFPTRWSLLAVAALLACLVPFHADTAFGQTAPSTPKPVWAQAGLKQVKLNWFHPPEARTGYEVRYKKSSASGWGSWTAISNSALLRTYTVTGLDAGVEYSFELRAVHSTIKGSSASVKATPWLTKPQVTADAQHQSVYLRWTWPSHGEVQAITDYEYRQRKGTGGTWGDWTSTGNGFRDGYSVSSLAGDGSTYQFQVRSKIDTTTGPASDTVSAKPYGPSGSVPSKPTGLTVQAGYDSALISWTASGDGEGGYCPTAGYNVRVYEVTPSMPMVAESLLIESGTSWYVDELNYPARHYVEIYSEAEDGCGEESDLVTTFFWTSASNTNPSAPATRKLRVPAPVRDLSIDTSVSGQVTITWKKPVNIGAKRSKRCAYVSAGGDQAQKHTDKAIDYSYYVYQEGYPNDTDIAEVDFRSADATLSKVVTGLPTGTGHRLQLQVEAYSWECNEWSKSRYLAWWSN